jgi:hypothetical protein
MEPYNVLKTALYENRILMYDYEPLKSELIALQKDLIKMKVDHPPRGRKDVADAVAGCLFALSQNTSADPLPIIKTNTTVNTSGNYSSDPSTGQQGWQDIMPSFIMGGNPWGSGDE